MKKQALFIHGGTTYKTQQAYLNHLRQMNVDLDRYKRIKWNDPYLLAQSLGIKFEVLIPKMPNPTNARFQEWAIVFTKILKKLNSNPILVGHSLGAVFLVKYLAVHKVPKKIKATLLIAPPYNDEPDEHLGSFTPPKNLSNLSQQGGQIIIYHSKDDPVVPFMHLRQYQEALPNALIRIFAKRGHFNQRTFPELIRDLRGL